MLRSMNSAGRSMTAAKIQLIVCLEGPR